MEEVTVSNWEEFEFRIGKLFRFREEKEEVGRYGLISDLLFRGQSNSKWKLQTTLERSFSKPTSLRQYYRMIFAIKPEVETFTQRTWDIPSLEEYNSWLSKVGRDLFNGFPGYAYMVYLRHYGFPSPLLDWTISPYIAAYFAFREISETAKSVAFFAYLEYAGKAKVAWETSPYINTLGPYIRSHTRHFLQKTQYTVCIKKEDDELVYWPHEGIFLKGKEDQDLLWKFIIPVSERKRVLKLLDGYNINSYSLFGSEESLIETLAIREILTKT